jgi:2-amino-4-hydroxy-6-hydroxymethyldihydropteridine diphosphokinase
MPLPDPADLNSPTVLQPLPVRAWIGLGANLGARHLTLVRALDALRQLPRSRLIARSRLWRSAPVDADGPDYLNAVAALDTRLTSVELLERMQTIESRFGRERPFRNAPRTLDLDLLLFGHERCISAFLQLPHPRMHQRAFVLAPLIELAPDIDIPPHGRARDLLRDLQHQPCTAIGAA